jgi:[CysO sulfur-carrier protein]-S-L-cysteine hydrolase
VNVSPELLEQIVEHALADPKNEVCGLVAVRHADADGEPTRAMRVHRARNIHESPLKFEIDGKELLLLNRAIEEDDCEIGAIYHSHVRSKPYPSQTDINFARNWPGLEWIIVGLTDPDAPEVRSYVIDGGEVSEVAI